MTSIARFLAVAALACSLHAQTTLIRNATVMTVSNGTLEGASVLIRDGKIAAWGKTSQRRRMRP
ncbi:MAG: hypothetical protein R2748_07150 [Bryobacterales bacterium]